MSRSWPLTLFILCLLVLVPPLETQNPETPRLTILLSNDDGYDAPGLRALVDAFQPTSDVIVAAPQVEQSGKGHGLTLRDPVFVSERKQPNGAIWYTIDAPPATCVRVAVESLLARRPDVVISGINRGDNLGITVYHSGTVGAAREAAIVGLPAIAVSIRGDAPEDYAAAAAFIHRLVEQLHTNGQLRPGVFLNVNVPAGKREGVRWVRLSVKPRHDTFEKHTSPRGRVYFWPDWKQLEDDEAGTDVWAFVRGYITVTPMTLDVTAVAEIKSLEGLDLRQPAPRR